MVKFIQIMIFDNESELINIFQFYIIIIKKKKIIKLILTN